LQPIRDRWQHPPVSHARRHGLAPDRRPGFAAGTQGRAAGVARRRDCRSPTPILRVVRDRFLPGITRGCSAPDRSALGLLASEEAGLDIESVKSGATRGAIRDEHHQLNGSASSRAVLNFVYETSVGLIPERD
jgi:hypothetical protein